MQDQLNFSIVIWYFNVVLVIQHSERCLYRKEVAVPVFASSEVSLGTGMTLLPLDVYFSSSKFLMKAYWTNPDTSEASISPLLFATTTCLSNVILGCTSSGRPPSSYLTGIKKVSLPKGQWIFRFPDF